MPTATPDVHLLGAGSADRIENSRLILGGRYRGASTDASGISKQELLREWERPIWSRTPCHRGPLGAPPAGGEPDVLAEIDQGFRGQSVSSAPRPAPRR